MQKCCSESYYRVRFDYICASLPVDVWEQWISGINLVVSEGTFIVDILAYCRPWKGIVTEMMVGDGGRAVGIYVVCCFLPVWPLFIVIWMWRTRRRGSSGQWSMEWIRMSKSKCHTCHICVIWISYKVQKAVACNCKGTWIRLIIFWVILWNKLTSIIIQ